MGGKRSNKKCTNARNYSDSQNHGGLFVLKNTKLWMISSYTLYCCRKLILMRKLYANTHRQLGSANQKTDNGNVRKGRGKIANILGNLAPTVRCRAL